MGFLFLIAFSIYGLECICDSLECNRGKNTPDNRSSSQGSLFNENPEPDSRARRPTSDRSPVRTRTIPGGIRHTADEDTDGSECEDSIDELEYMRHFFH